MMKIKIHNTITNRTVPLSRRRQVAPLRHADDARHRRVEDEVGGRVERRLDVAPVERRRSARKKFPYSFFPDYPDSSK